MLKRLFRHLRSIRAFIMVVRDPERTDLIFVVITDPLVLNDTNFAMVTEKLRSIPKASAMLESRFEGKWDLETLLKLPKNTLGYVYAKHMTDLGLEINFYPPVPGQTVEAYIQSRSRQTHDIMHVMTGFDTSIAGEIALQSFTQVQLSARSPTLIMTMFLLHCAFFKPALLLEATRAMARGWYLGENTECLFGERFEENWSKDLSQYRREVGLTNFSVADAGFTLPHVREVPISVGSRTSEKEPSISL